MSEQIRPMAHFKQRNTSIWALMALGYWGQKPNLTGNAKSKENAMYAAYAVHIFEQDALNNKWSDEFFTPRNFFWATTPENNVIRNKVLLSEMGRLIMIGWYYGSETQEFAYKICKSIYENIADLNKQDCVKAVKHTRSNFGHYYHNQNKVADIRTR